MWCSWRFWNEEQVFRPRLHLCPCESRTLPRKENPAHALSFASLAVLVAGQAVAAIVVGVTGVRWSDDRGKVTERRRCADRRRRRRDPIFAPFVRA
jgi:hypothetical protein